MDFINKIDHIPKYDFNDVMMIPYEPTHISSRKEVELTEHYKFENLMELHCVPIVASNMDRIGTIKMYKELSKYNIITCFTKQITLDELVNTDVVLDPNLYILSSGVSDSDMEELENKICSLNPRMVCFDVANGYMINFIKKIKLFRERHPYITIIAGNIVTSSILYKLKDSGVDIVKVGIGSGSVCTTRLKTGVGYPQFSAILDMKTKAQELNMRIMSDGGIKYPGDVAKAFGAGASFVMIGGMFAGHNECINNSELMNQTNSINNEIKFYGNSSNEALYKHYGGTKKYRTTEGKSVTIKCKGPISNTLEDLLGGLRSSCAYLNCKNLSQLFIKSKFIVVRQQVNNMFNK